MSSLTVIESSLLHRSSDEGITVPSSSKKPSSHNVPYLRLVDDDYLDSLHTAHRLAASTVARPVRDPHKATAVRTRVTARSARSTAQRLCLPSSQALPITSDTYQQSASNGSGGIGDASLSFIGKLAAWALVCILVISAGASLGYVLAPQYSGATEVYTVQEGDTMWALADHSGMASTEEAIQTIVTINNLDSTSIHPGQQLEIPVHPARLKPASQP